MNKIFILALIGFTSLLFLDMSGLVKFRTNQFKDYCSGSPECYMIDEQGNTLKFKPE